MKCRTDSKKYCSKCEHFDYCDIANKCDGNCHKCDDYDCENNTEYKGEPETKKKKFEFSTLYSLCNREQLFTCGDNRQYGKMFDIAGNGVTQTKLTYILYICSDKELDAINNMLTPLFKED